MNIDDYFRVLVKRGGSDLHLKVGRPPLMRIKGELLPTEYPVIGKEEMEKLLLPMLTEMQMKKLESEREIDFSCLVEGLARFRGNIFHQMGFLGAVFRMIPVEIVTIDQLNLPQVLKELIFRNQGVILVTGPTGSGKSTTLAGHDRLPQ
jgi:twitching motility protein PilT